MMAAVTHGPAGRTKEPAGTLDLYEYELPPERIALSPIEPRDACRLMVLDRSREGLVHGAFRDLPQWLRRGDVLVLNDSRVLPARLRGERDRGGSVELLLLRKVGSGGAGEIWSCLARPGRRLRPGTEVRFADFVRGTVLDGGGEDAERLVRLVAPRPIVQVLEEIGEVPLPPYIRRPAGAADRADYQTVYASVPGSVAAPTAGMHFTTELLDRLLAAGVERHFLTLHVGPATFLPVRTSGIERHRMGDEEVEIPARTASALLRARSEGRRIIAIGTTTVRALEGGRLDPDEGFRGPVSLFIRPGHRFRFVDGMITNFHLPRSTLLMLVSAFAGRERILGAYAGAIAAGYRFYSYGDAMLIL